MAEEKNNKKQLKQEPVPRLVEPQSTQTTRPSRTKTPEAIDPKKVASGKSAKGARPPRSAPQRRKTRANKGQSRRLIYVLLGIVLMAVSIGTFLLIQGSSDSESTVTVLVANRDLVRDDRLAQADFNVVSIPSDSPLESAAITPEEFAASLSSVSGSFLVATENIPEGTLINNSLIALNTSSLERQKVDVSIFIPEQGFAAGTPAPGTRVALIAYIPQTDVSGPLFVPLLVDRIINVRGNRITFRLSIDRSTYLQRAQLSATAQRGYIILWNAAPGLNEADTLTAAENGFARSIF